MEISPNNTLPNQTETTKEVVRKTEENLEMWKQNVNKEINKLKNDNKEMRGYISKLDTSQHELLAGLKEKKSTTKQKDRQKDGLLVRGIFWFSLIIFTFGGGFWIYETMVTYRSESFYASTNIIHNKTFTWPTISVTPYYMCFNNTAVKELKETYNFTTFSKRWTVYKHLHPFEITDKKFNLSVYNVSEMYLQTKYRPPLVNFTVMCTYNSAAINESNCYNKSMGKWETYDTQYNAVQSFTPAPASSIKDKISITINAQLCKYFYVYIHPSTDRYYAGWGKKISVFPGRHISVNVAVNELHKISTRSSPCVEDTTYSKIQCHDAKLIKYKIKKAGCHFPAITGYQQQGGQYPECNNHSSYNNFMHWHKQLLVYEKEYDDLQQIKNECAEPCHTKKYITKRRSRKITPYSKKYSHITIRMDQGAMSYTSVSEKKVVTVDMLVGNVGGILGLFLGVSCLSAISAIQFVIRKVIIKIKERNPDYVGKLITLF